MSTVDECIDAIHDLLHGRAQSIGILDIAVEDGGSHIDGEILFSEGPDLGFTIYVKNGVASYCELVGDDDERWLDTTRDGLALADPEAFAKTVLDGLLAARREVVRGGEL